MNAPAPLNPKDLLKKALALPTPRGRSTLEDYKDVIVEMRSKGHSYSKIAEFLTENGVPISQQSVIKFCKTNNIPVGPKG